MASVEYRAHRSRRPAQRSRAVAVAAAVVAGLLAAVLHGMLGRANDLQEAGPQAVGRIWMTKVHRGDDILLALPLFENGSSDPLSIKSVRVLHVPRGIEVIDYRTLSIEQTDGVLLTWNRRTPVDGDPDWLSESRPGVPAIEVPPRSTGDDYVLVHIQVRAQPTDDMTGVEVVYRRNGHDHTQRLRGQWGIELQRKRPPEH